MSLKDESGWLALKKMWVKDLGGSEAQRIKGGSVQNVLRSYKKEVMPGQRRRGEGPVPNLLQLPVIVMRRTIESSAGKKAHYY